MIDRLSPFITHIHAQILERYPADKPYSAAAIEQMILPLDIRHYLLYLLEQRPIEALQQLPYREWFPAHAPEEQAGWQAFEQVLRASVRIPSTEWPESTLEAATHVSHYLIDPIATLKGMVFQEVSTLSAGEVLRRMGYFRAYPYFKRILESYVRARRVREFQVTDFEHLLHRIDEKITGEYEISDWLDHFTPLYNLTTFLPEHLSGIPTWLLRQYFRTRPYPELQRRLLHMEQVQNISHISQEMLRNLLSQMLPSTTESPPPSSSDEASSTSSTLPLWQRFARRRGPYTAPAIRRNQPVPPGSSQALQQPMNAPPSTSPPSSPEIEESLEQLEKVVFGVPIPGERYAFIASLFGGKTAAYRDALKKLSSASTWERASQIIAYHVFLPNEVNIYTEPAVRFTDLIEARFKRRSS